MSRSRVCWVVAIAVAAATIAAAPQWSSALTIALGVGESQPVGSEGLVVGFEQIVGDSRCPIEVQCFWEGDATARVWADLPGEPKMVVDLHSHPGFQRGFDYGDYRVTLTQVLPYPVYPDVIDPTDYVIKLTVAGDLIPTPVEPTTWSRIKALYR